MKFYVKKDGSEAIMSFSDEEVEILKKNNNNFTLRRKDLPHFKNHLARIITDLADVIPDKTQSYGHEEFKPLDISKKK
tara:strand:- start:242 stop:475 length:234 start_codon:yes stop_codon:yes gene_type:complete